MGYDYQRGSNFIKLDKLLSLLALLPSDSVIWPNSTGSLSVVDADGVYLGYVDTGWREEVSWCRPVQATNDDGADGFFG